MEGKLEALFQRQIMADVEFLYQQNVMDYSLLLGISKDYEECSFSIIDYNQRYNLQKKLEHFIKSIYNPMKKDQLSCTNQRKYSKRFLRFVLNITLKS